MTDTPKKCGYIAIMGAANAGKSTLINALVGEKVTIVSPKVQTTRNRILGITLIDNAQIILIDTPGIFSGKGVFDRSMVQAAWQGLDEADSIAVLVDVANKKARHETQKILDRIRKIYADPKNPDEIRRDVVLILNKIDKIPVDKLLPISEELNQEFPFKETFMISGLKGKGLDGLKKWMMGTVPESPWLYNEEQITTLPFMQAAAELTREKLFLNLHQEIPYAVHVTTDDMFENPTGGITIQQTIHVLKDSQKAIIIGKGGQSLKRIGTASRQELQEQMERKIHLDLFVKVNAKWQDQALREQLEG